MKYIICILLILSIMSCRINERRDNKINKIEFARSGAWTDWGAAISIDSLLEYNYLKNCGPTKKQYYNGKVSPAFWDTLNRNLEAIKFTEIQLIDSSVIQDAHYFELIIYGGNRKTRITRVWDDKKDAIGTTLKWINTSYKNIQLKQVEGPLQFETIYQNPPPLPKVNGVKFPPPVKK